jgi:hypothetical protein
MRGVNVMQAGGGARGILNVARKREVDVKKRWM